MTSSQYISVREAAQLLRVSESKVLDLIEKGELKGYRIANQFLRLKKGEVTDLRTGGSVQAETTRYPYSTGERLVDFLYYNDFYLASMVVIAGLLFVILSNT